VTVSQDRDRVVLGLTGRKRDVLLDCGAAEELVWQLRGRAAKAEKEPPTLCTEIWGVQVESYDGFVALRFAPPFVGRYDKVRLTADTARRLADLVEFKAQQARWKCRIVVA
jgi:hypothetical protein